MNIPMITVNEAEKLILDNTCDFGAEIVMFDQALGRVLAETVKADRDLPAFDRVTMDGIAIKHSSIEKGISTFTVKSTQAAGDMPIETDSDEECVEIMTGAALPASLDTIVRYEDVRIEAGKAMLLATNIKSGQNLHLKGSDKRQGDVLLTPGQLITPAVVSLAASVGEDELRVKRLPKVVVISSGDELVEVSAKPSPYQIRRSNSYMVQAILAQQGIKAVTMHIPDDPETISQQLGVCLQNYDVILLSGGISMGKFDNIPQALQQLEVKQIFHKVKQRPGKPFWFGRHDNGVVVFAFPGNPVSTFMCTQRYFIPWLNASLGKQNSKSIFAVLDSDFNFEPQLTCYLQVKLAFSEQGRLLATPLQGNGSGDFANLADTDAFMELPSDINHFKRGEVYRIYLFNQLQ
jgi:molybdopterin molybdotransferase